MWIGKIGQKSAAFINHKPFHPGNWQNQEKIWLAEQKHKEELKKQAELAERREEEMKIQELRRALYSQGFHKSSSSSSSSSAFSSSFSCGEGGTGAATGAAAAGALKKGSRSAQETRKKEAAEAAARRAAEQRRKENMVTSTLYVEDVKVGAHGEVWGSFFDRETRRWGFACCRCCDRQQRHCPAAPAAAAASSASHRRNKKRKKKTPVFDAVSSSPATDAAADVKAPAAATAAGPGDGEEAAADGEEAAADGEEAAADGEEAAASARDAAADAEEAAAGAREEAAAADGEAAAGGAREAAADGEEAAGKGGGETGASAAASREGKDEIGEEEFGSGDFSGLHRRREVAAAAASSVMAAPAAAAAAGQQQQNGVGDIEADIEAEAKGTNKKECTNERNDADNTRMQQRNTAAAAADLTSAVKTTDINTAEAGRHDFPSLDGDGTSEREKKEEEKIVFVRRDLKKRENREIDVGEKQRREGDAKELHSSDNRETLSRRKEDPTEKEAAAHATAAAAQTTAAQTTAAQPAAAAAQTTAAAAQTTAAAAQTAAAAAQTAAAAAQTTAAAAQTTAAAAQTTATAAQTTAAQPAGAQTTAAAAQTTAAAQRIGAGETAAGGEDDGRGCAWRRDAGAAVLLSRGNEQQPQQPCGVGREEERHEQMKKARMKRGRETGIATILELLKEERAFDDE